jgi:tRNA-specific 2-thiouridylase
MSKVLVAMSGGVDSSVAAVLLAEEGADVVGVTMRLSGDYDTDRLDGQKGCCTLDDADDARRVCQIIGVPHYVMNLEREFEEHVISYFVSEYQRGRTPHPCLACNDLIKFDFLLKRAEAMGFDHIATGHYARLDHNGDCWRLRKAVTSAKDQSYVLFGLSQREMERVLFPVGHYEKEEIRAIALRSGLPVADKPDSQEICFIPGDYRDFLRTRVEPTPGNIVDTSGTVLGSHEGVEFFTIGQRRGLGIATAAPRYVVAVHPSTATVVVGMRDELLQAQLWASRVNWISGEPPSGPIELSAKIRYKASEAPATVTPLPGNAAQISFQEPQRAVTPGQAVVFYQGEEVLGGGYIELESPNENRSPLASGAPSVVTAQ